MRSLISATLLYMKKATPTATPKLTKEQEREQHGYHPAYRRFPPGRPLAECKPIDHPRGKDGGWEKSATMKTVALK